MRLNENRAVLTDSAGLQLVVSELTTLRMTMTLQDESGVPVAAAALTTLKLTLYLRDAAALTILNGVDHVDILNTGRGTVGVSDGLVTITFLPADSPISDTSLDQEWHRALIEWTYAAGAKGGRQEIDFPVRNLNKVP